MNNEKNRELNVALKTLDNCVSELSSHIGVLESQEGAATETNYDEILHITMHVVSAARYMTEALNTISADANLEPPGPVPGAARNVDLEYSHKVKEEVACMALISANCILNSYNRRIGYPETEVANVCYNVLYEEN